MCLEKGSRDLYLPVLDAPFGVTFGFFGGAGLALSGT